MAGVALVVIFFANQAISQNIRLNPIKPAAKSGQLTDEQQAILAVRKAKASTVSIVGVGKTQGASSSGQLSLSAPVTSEVFGTGVILEADGLVVTNNHVVSDANFNYTVVLADGSKYPAKVLASDKISDIAFLKIEAKGLAAAVLGDSDSLETGQTVFAIGNSLGRYQNSVTRGVVSALGRALSEVDGTGPRIHNLIQTDAAISQGNSGGPLVNLAGEVVGINTLIDTGGYSLNFAVPANLVKDGLAQLKAFGKISRPFLGVQFVTIDPLTQIGANLPVNDGALITGVYLSSPARTAGLEVNDVITAINGQNLDSRHELDFVLQQYQAGNQVMLKILRGQETLEVPVILGEYK